MTWAFLLTSFVIVATPGTGALFTLAAGLARRGRAGVLAAFACTLGIVPHLLAAVTGLAALLHASGVAFNVVKYAGVGYLLYLAWTTWRDTGALAVDASDSAARSWRSVVVSGVTVNLLNPKLTIFFVAFLPQFVPAGSTGSVVPMLALSGVFMAMTFVVFAVYGVLVGLRRVFAATFVGLGARLAVESR